MKSQYKGQFISHKDKAIVMGTMRIYQNANFYMTIGLCV